MATLHDATSLSKSAALLAGNNSEINTMEVVDLYSASYVKFEEVARTANDKTETMLQWGIAITNHYKLKGIKGSSASQLFDSAQQKFETALLSAKDEAHVILHRWGVLLLEQGKKLKEEGQNESAQSSLSAACKKFNESFAKNHTFVDPLHSWKLALTEQATMADGNQRLWFESQVAEKGRWIEKLNNNEAIDLPAKIELSPQDKLKKGNEEKEIGNEFFKKGDFTNALRHYHNAMNYAHGLYGLPPQEEKGLKELKTSVYNNMAVVHIKQGKTDRAINDLRMVLELDANNVKALFRRGKLWHTIGEIDKSRADLDKARQLDPASKEIIQEIQLLEKKEKEQTAKQKQFFSKMFE